MTRHIDIRFAGVTDETLAEIVSDYDAWNEFGSLSEDAELRLMARKFGTNGPIAMLTTALIAFREIIARRDCETAVGEITLQAAE